MLPRRACGVARPVAGATACPGDLPALVQADPPAPRCRDSALEPSSELPRDRDPGAGGPLRPHSRDAATPPNLVMTRALRSRPRCSRITGGRGAQRRAPRGASGDVPPPPPPVSSGTSGARETKAEHANPYVIAAGGKCDAEQRGSLTERSRTAGRAAR